MELTYCRCICVLAMPW